MHNELTGTPKQVAWATSIRSQVLAELASADLPEQARTDTAGLLAVPTAARWWIEQRDVPAALWPDLLGAGQPALAPSYPPGRTGPATAARIAAGLQTAEQVRAVLDAAGVDRIAYRLRLSGVDEEKVELAMAMPADAASPADDVTGRQAVAPLVVDALAQAGWRVGGVRDQDVVLRHLAAGALVTIWPAAQ